MESGSTSELDELIFYVIPAPASPAGGSQE